MFKVAELVIMNDNRRARVLERLGPRRWLVRTFDGETVPAAQGDLARPGEDYEIARREEEIANWALAGGGHVLPGVGFATTDGRGNYRAPSAPESDEIRTWSDSSQMGASPAERAALGIDD